jgi:uncharacterized phage protein (TIGR02220 family)
MMARSRNIKPGFFKNEDLAELPFHTRLLFIGLWTLADREGRLEDRPKRIKMEIFPGDNVDIDQALSQLHQFGFILRYQAAGQRFIAIPTFLDHQNPHHKEAPSTIPKPEALPPSNNVKASDSSGNESGINLGQALDSSAIEVGVNRADSLIPDSLNLIPDKSNVGQKPDAHPLNGKNGKAGRRYQANRVNLGFILARLKDGATEIECRQVIAKKCREWGSDPKMVEYLRPATLFNATKFAQYQGELGAPNVSRETSAAPARSTAGDPNGWQPGDELPAGFLREIET